MSVSQGYAFWFSQNCAEADTYPSNLFHRHHQEKQTSKSKLNGSESRNNPRRSKKKTGIPWVAGWLAQVPGIRQDSWVWAQLVDREQNISDSRERGWQFLWFTKHGEPLKALWERRNPLSTVFQAPTKLSSGQSAPTGPSGALVGCRREELWAWTVGEW